MVLITCVRKVMRLKSLFLIDYHVKIEFLRLFFCYLVQFELIALYVYQQNTHASVTLINLFLLPQNNTYFNDCKMFLLSKCWGILAISQLELNAFSQFSEVSLQIIYQY